MIRSITSSFYATRALGLDISRTMIKAVEVISSKEGLLLNHAAVRPIGNNDNSAQLLKKMLAETGFRSKQVALGVSSPQVVVQSFQFPKMPKDEMTSAIELEAEHAILNGHDPSSVIVDWHFLNDASEELTRGILAVIPKELLSEQTQTVKAAGLSPSVVDVKGLALWNAYWILLGSKEPSSKTTLLIYLDADTTHLVIVRGPDTLILARDIELGADALQNNKDHWFSELHDSLVYARSKGGLRALDNVIVTGFAQKEVLSALESALELPVKFWNPLDDLLHKEDNGFSDRSQGPLLAVAIGLALRRVE